VVLIAFFHTDSLVHHEFAMPGQSVTGHFYVQVLQRLRDAGPRKRRHELQGQWFLHRDNALSHTSLVQQFLGEKNIPLITQLSYSLDLVLSDFWLFPTLENGPQVDTFCNCEGLQMECDGQTPEDSK
jgi:hypothetical protein